MSKFELSRVATAFRKAIDTCLPDKPQGVVAGISGGPDSMALLYVLHRFNIQTLAIHCNYGLRGDASDQDQKLVEECCSLWNIDCVSVRLDPGESGKKNFQAWARDRRYQIFSDLLKENEYDLIITAHHRDDQIETILQKVLRGSGFSSWKGMDVLQGKRFRPFLSVDKSDIMQFLHHFNIPYRIDSSNEESTYARNFIRNTWFPKLNELFPGWKTNLLEIPFRAEEFDLLVHHISNQILTGSGFIKRDNFLQLDEKLQPVILHSVLKEKFPDANIKKAFLNHLAQLQTIQTGASLSICKDVSLIRDRDFFVIQSEHSRKISHSVISKKDLISGMSIPGFRLILEEVSGQFETDSIQVDVHMLTFPLRIRKWKEGDSFIPLGMKGTQLISDHLTNRKIPAVLKSSAKVIETFDHRICAVIFPIHSGLTEIGTISEIDRCTDTTKQTLIIRKII